MKAKRILYILSAALMFVGLGSFTAEAQTYVNGFKDGGSASDSDYYQTPSGSGTSADPYQINNAGNLWWFAKYVNGLSAGNQAIHAKLTADIDMGGSSKGSFPGIGRYQGAVYAGTFDGQGHTISNFYISQSTSNAGLFSHTDGATIENLNISGAMTVSGYIKHGSVVGWAMNSTIKKVYSSVTVTAGSVQQTGGLVGCLQKSTAEQCRYSGTLSSSNAYNKIAGLAGSMVGGKLIDCLFDGTLTLSVSNSSLIAGGLVACTMDAADNAITNCLMNGNINITNPTSKCGVIVGYISKFSFTGTNIYYNSTTVSAGLSTDSPALENSNGTAPTWSMSATAVDPTAAGFSWGTVKNSLNAGSTNWGINRDKAVYPIPGEIDKDPTPVTTYTITFEENGGSDCENVTKPENTTITLPTPTKSGYIFTGWNTANDGSGTTYSGGSSYTITANATLYAQWTVYTTSYDANGFNTQFSTCAEADKYEPATLVDGYYQIDNAGKMWWFALKLKSGAIANTCNVKITADIDMDGTNHTDFPGIGYYISNTDNKAFAGNFDGQKHRIYNCNITSTTGGWGSGLIAHADGTSKTIKDFTLEGTITAKCNSYAGGVLGYIAKGYTISGITSSVTINSTCIKTAGLVGYINAGSIDKCRFNGTINSSASWVGGLVGELSANVPVSNCLFDGTINSTYNKNDLGLGGITALPKGNTISNCLVYGQITTTQTAATSANVGKVFGRVDGNLTLTNVYYGEKAPSTPTNLYNTNGKTITGTPTYVGDTPDWNAIKNTLGSENWGINSQDYPVPGEADNTQYTVTFDSKGGSSCDSETKAAGTVITLPTPTKSGYLFTGWNTAENGSGTSYAAGASYTITANVTLYAQWTEDESGDYINGFHKTHAKTADDYYQAPVEVTEANYASLGLTSDYVGYYQVKNAGNMFWISKNFSSIENTRKFVMTADIDMAGNDDNHKDWAGIATTYSADCSTHFQGVFDGLGHKFTNYYMNVTSGNYKSMFGVVTKGTIKNFSIAGSVDINNTGAQYGVVVGRFNEGPNTIEDIHSSVKITVTDGKKPTSIGGVIGQNSSGNNLTTVNRCRYSGTITGNSAYNGIGGILGNTEGKLTMTNCLFDGKISSTSTATKTMDSDGIRIGGLAGGQTGNPLTIQNCLVVGTIEVNSSSEAVGNDSHSGIVFGDNSTTQNLTITNTYYSTTGCTSGLRAVGLNNYSDKTKAAPTLIENQTWLQIKTSLNKGTTNWGINSKVYPVPGETDSALQYTVTFDSKGGSDCPSVTEVENTVITLPTPYWSGHAFDSWNTAEDGTGTSYNGGAAYTITAAATLYAQWTAVAYDYDSDGFHISFAEVPDEMKYEAPKLITSSRCNELFISTSYASDGYYEVKNAGNMFWISQNLSPDNNTRKYIVTADIDMKGNMAAHQNWTGIGEFVNGNSDKNFRGTFDGNGHKFTNYYMLANRSYIAMFCAPDGATIKNFSISGSLFISFENNFSTYNQIGVIAGRVVGTTTFEDIHSSVNITIKDGNTPLSVGGLVGQCSATTKFNRCRYSGTINANSASTGIGGIFGNTEAAITLDNCLFDGSIISTSNQTFEYNDYGGAKSGVVIGGLGGVTNRALTIKNCMSIGTIKIDQTSDKEHSGIILGINGKKTTETGRKLTVSNTYYRTTESTTGVNAVGLNTAEEADQTAAAPTVLPDAPVWTTIQTNLGADNWLIDYTEYQRYYPVPARGAVIVKDGCYYIRNVVQFQAFRDAVNTAGGVAVNAKLVGDIDFGVSDFGDPVGNSEDNPYVGTFDGQGYSISNIRISSGNQFTGLFGNAGNDGDNGKSATIKNFSIAGTISTSYSSSSISDCSPAHMGVIGRLANGSVEGVSSNVAFTDENSTAAHFGGVVGCTFGVSSSKTIKNCQFTGSITADAWHAVGGIAGYTPGNTVLASNYFGGTINLSSCNRADANTYLGGILGFAGGSSTLALSYNVSYGSLTPATSGTTHKGVILGYTERTDGVYTDNYSQVASDNNSTESGKITNIIVASGLSAGEKTAKLGIHWRVVDEGGNQTLSPDNIISADDNKYVLKYIYIDDKADNLTWKYANFENAASINALKIVYVRAAEYMTTKYITTCLPFTLPVEQLPGYNASGNNNDLIVLQYNDMDNGDAIFLPVLNKKYKAGVPYLLKLPASARNTIWSVTIEDENGITLIDSVKNPSESATNIFGSFETKVINTGYYKLHPDGTKFVKTKSGSHCFPYRAYLKVVSNSSQNSVSVKFE